MLAKKPIMFLMAVIAVVAMLGVTGALAQYEYPAPQGFEPPPKSAEIYDTKTGLTWYIDVDIAADDSCIPEGGGTSVACGVYTIRISTSKDMCLTDVPQEVVITLPPEKGDPNHHCSTEFDLIYAHPDLNPSGSDLSAVKHMKAWDFNNNADSDCTWEVGTSSLNLGWGTIGLKLNRNWYFTAIGVPYCEGGTCYPKLPMYSPTSTFRGAKVGDPDYGQKEVCVEIVDAEKCVVKLYEAACSDPNFRTFEVSPGAAPIVKDPSGDLHTLKITSDLNDFQICGINVGALNPCMIYFEAGGIWWWLEVPGPCY
jgi:hypothetical protein